jgi:hypothetical protein
MKKSVEIEKLLQWAYLDELPKRQISSAEGIWDRLAQYGSLGGVNPDPGGSGNAQRYAQFGLPHRDAELIEIAVGQLGRAAFDWRRYFDIVAGDLAALITINDVRDGLRVPAEDPMRAFVEPARDGRGVTSRVARHAPRDVLLVNSVNLSALVTTHAVKGTRPDWRTEQMRPVPMLAERSKLAIVIGKSKAKNLYTTGSYCPLVWSPSPVEVALTRADYLMWHQALITLAQTLTLTEHQVLTPEAPATPWIDGEQKKRLHRSQHIGEQKTLPLALARKRAGPPSKKPKKDKGRIIKVAEGRFP